MDWNMHDSCDLKYYLEYGREGRYHQVHISTRSLL